MPAVCMEAVSKYFYENHVQAVDSACFSAYRGEIHALVGENGAGKSTLMKILYGLEKAGSGTTAINDQPVKNPVVKKMKQLGLGYLPQHFRLFGPLTVYENLCAGREPSFLNFFYNRKKAVQLAGDFLLKYRFKLQPEASVENLSVHERQQLELARLLYADADILILDEPTDILAEQESAELFNVLKNLRAEGKCIILISHKLNEVLDISDRITVMRNGKTVFTSENKGLDKKSLSGLIMGTEEVPWLPAEKNEPGPVVLQAEKLALRGRKSRKKLLDNISFEVRSGEVFGITGISGNGLKELEDVLTGFARPDEGQLLLNGTDFGKLDIGLRRKTGLAYIPSERFIRGAALNASFMENIAAIEQGGPGFFLNLKALRSRALEAVSRLDIKAWPDMPLGTLSGGNIQKTIFARESSREAALYVLCEPAWGVDAAARNLIYQIIAKLKKAGKAVVLITGNMDDLLQLADKFIVLYRGRVSGCFINSENIKKEQLGEYMLGLKQDGCKDED